MSFQEHRHYRFPKAEFTVKITGTAGVRTNFERTDSKHY